MPSAGKISQRAAGQSLPPRQELSSLPGALMRGPISEAVIVVALGFLIGGIAEAINHFLP
jgi:hypothetical protein